MKPEDNVHKVENAGGFTLALIALAILYFLMGFTTVLNDTLVPFFKDGFQLTYSQSSLVQFYFYLTYGLISIPAGKLVEKIGYKHGMVWGFCIAAAGAFLFYPAAHFHQYVLFLAALFVVAIGIVTLQVSANPYITVLGPEQSAASRLTLIQGVGSVGTTLAPVFGAHFILSKVDASQGSGVLVKPYLLIGATLLLVGGIVYILKLPVVASKKPGGEGALSVMQMLRTFPNLKYGVIALFAYVGAEVAIGTYLTNYIADTVFISEREANVFVSYYWGGMLIGRLAGASVLRYFKANKVLVAMSLLAGVFITGSLLSDGYLSVWLMVAVGVCNSVMFASIFSLSVKGLGPSTGKGSGMLSAAIVGGALITFLQGYTKDLFSWSIAFIIPVTCYLFIFLYGYKFYKSKKVRSL
ncbi:sugar MFS transporter [Niabella sp. 22666]|uniref:sugar MFS transporter n=1 Tax=Niabella sp. 22666 TaxID=3453954 RepID=UPI003F849499